MTWIAVGVAMVVYMFCPTFLQLVLIVINCFVPDAIPIIDEAIMVVGMVAKLNAS